MRIKIIGNPYGWTQDGMIVRGQLSKKSEGNQ